MAISQCNTIETQPNPVVELVIIFPIESAFQVIQIIINITAAPLTKLRHTGTGMTDRVSTKPLKKMDSGSAKNIVRYGVSLF
jgi:hypothetical protein